MSETAGQARGESAGQHPAIDAYAQHVNPAFVRLLGLFGYGRVLVRAEGTRVWDDQGRCYLDLLAGYGSANVGHNHPRLIERLTRHLTSNVPGLIHTGPKPQAAELAVALAERLPDPLSITLFANTGGEAVDAALKLARAATGRGGFVYCRDGYHGMLLGTLSVMGAERMRRPFTPLLPGCVEVPFGDLATLEAAVTRNRPAAFIVEPILGEGGVVLPPPGYLRAAAELCRRVGALFILDEVQTGLGRTGRLFAMEHEQVVPDVVVLAKALGGGIAPIGCAVTSGELHRRAYGAMDKVELQGSTFAGSALPCVTALETLAIVDDEGLAQNAAERGRQLLAGLRAVLADHPMVRHVRGRGLLVGIELGPRDATLLQRVAPRLVDQVAKRAFGQWAALKLLEAGFLVQPGTHTQHVLKLEPPLTITEAEVDEAIEAIGRVLNDYRELPKLLADVSLRLGEQALGGWRFR